MNAALDEDYIYDDLGRLVEWKVNDVSQQTWTLDSLGNDLSTGTYNEANEMTPTVGNSGYDAAGNMTTLQSGMTAKYDAWNRLVEVKDGEDIIQQNEYDGTNRRIQIFTDFTGSTPATTQDDYHSGQQIIETRENASIKYQHIWSKRYIDALILRDTYSSGSIVTADRLFYLSDANYNVTALVKYDSGQSAWQVAERYTYTPYGEVTYRNPAWTDVGSSANNNLTLYTGRTLDPETDLMYYRARYYDPTLERFISRDPIGYAAGDMNLYRYVGNNPTNLTDPMGLTGRGRHHGYPKYLGGRLKQPVWDFTKDAEGHRAAQRYLRQRFPYNDAGRAAWKKLSAAEQRAMIAKSLEAGGVESKLIAENIDEIMKGAKPGMKITGRGFGKVLATSTLLSAVSLVLAMETPAYAAEYHADWRNDKSDKKGKVECATFDVIIQVEKWYCLRSTFSSSVWPVECKHVARTSSWFDLGEMTAQEAVKFEDRRGHVTAHQSEWGLNVYTIEEVRCRFNGKDR